MTNRLIALLIAAFIALTGAARADEALLTVEGGTDGRQSYSRADLEALPVTSFTTATLWTEGQTTFTGVALSDFLAEIGVTEGELRATALNDYSVMIPVADAVEGGPIIAYEVNGAPMSAREKGPLWIIYPFDLNSDYQTETFYSRSIWQLNRIAASP